MAKKLINITESDLHNMVLEALSILYEDDNAINISNEEAELRQSTYTLGEVLDILKSSVSDNEYRQFISLCTNAIQSHTQSYTVDNFDLIASLMNFNSDDDFYYCEIIKRKKDNPNDDFRYRQFVGNFWITSANELQSKKNAIIKVCQENNARAYIYMNPRSAQAVKDYANNVLKPRFAQKGKGYGKYRGHELEFAAGQHKADWDNRPICFLDIDIAANEVSKYCGLKGQEIFDKVYDLLQQNNITPLASYKTPNGGLHILLPDKTASKIDFTWADGNRDRGQYATVHLNFDSPTLLYSSIKPQGYKD